MRMTEPGISLHRSDTDAVPLHCLRADFWRRTEYIVTGSNFTDNKVPNQSTPIKHGTSTLFKFTTNHRYRLKEMTDMGNEMKDYIVGPMPAAEFLDEFFPLNSLRTSSRAQAYQPGCFQPVISSEKESDVYEPFVRLYLFINPLQLTIWQSLYR